MWSSGYLRVPPDEPQDDRADSRDENSVEEQRGLRFVVVCAFLLIVPTIFVIIKALL